MEHFLVALVVAGLWSSSVAVITRSGCGVTKTCMSNIEGCEPSTADCVFFSWKWTGAVFEMELSGKSGNGATYNSIAFGIADQMRDADTYYCTGNTFVSAVMTGLHIKPTDLDAENDPGLSKMEAANVNGVAQCTFTRAPSVNKTISGGVSEVFDLSSKSYYILGAHGAMKDGSTAYHGNTNRFITPVKINMTAPPEPEPEPQTSTPTPATQAPGCGTTKGCSQLPEGCSKESPNCVYFTWEYDSSANNWKMELSGGKGNGEEYAAVAFGQADDMRDADLYYCTGTSLKSGAITTFHGHPEDTDMTGLENVEMATTNGVAKCTFTRAASITKPDTNGNHDYDLSSQSYSLLLARGPVSSGTIQIHRARTILAKTDFKGNVAGGKTGANVLKKAHGGLMVAAWLILANVGVVIARHFKPLWPDIQPGGVKFWFTLHRAIMVLVLLITAAAFIIIFVHVQGYSSQANAHAIIGIIIMALTLLNPIMALFRPAPDSPTRWLFNTFHRCVGLAARGLGIANLFTGANALKLSSWSNAVLGGFVGFMVLLEIIFEILSWKYEHFPWQKKKSNKPAGDGDLEIEEPNVGVRGQTPKNILLVIYSLGLLAFAITFFVDISNA